MQRRICPGCESAMLAVDLDGVEVDRCPFCGGVWFDRGELERVTGRVLEAEPLAGSTTRRCAFCRITLSTAMIGSIPVEVCDSCRGTYLDDGELEELANREISWRRMAGPPAPSRVEQFMCRGCGEAHDIRDAMTTAYGLSCPRCYPMLQAGSPGPAPMGLTMEERLEMGAANLIAGQVLPSGFGSLIYLGLKSLFGGSR
jgi:hypothetical protein